MPVFVRKRATFGRMTFEPALRTPWNRWFAWYPVTEMSDTYWLMWVEWRNVRSSGWRNGERFTRSDYLEYRKPGDLRRDEQDERLRQMQRPGFEQRVVEIYGLAKVCAEEVIERARQCPPEDKNMILRSVIARLDREIRALGVKEVS